MLKRAIEQCGHRCLVATNGAEAWEQFQAGGADVVITDWVMPLMDGPELCQRIRAHPSTSYSYVVLLTSLDDKEHFLEGMEAGADDYLPKPLGPDQLRARLIAAGRVLALHQRLAQQNAELAELNRALGESARTDPLTGLGNRLRLWEDLRTTQNQLDRYGAQYAVAMCDIDYFKAYNDRYGHPAGDEALRAVASAMARECRSADRAYRYGGEEFLILLPAQAVEGAEAAINRIRLAIQALQISHEASSVAGVVTMSAGVAVAAPTVTLNPETLVSNADTALYRAKESGRNRVVVYLPPAPPR
jgi:two-component system chemotaxis response regulator CheY